MHDENTFYPDPEGLLTEAQAAGFLAVSMRTLQAWRVRGNGPPFVKVGRGVRYRRCDLTAWTRDHTATSTSNVPQLQL